MRKNIPSTEAEIQDGIVQLVADRLNMDPRDVDLEGSLLSLGLSSREMLQLSGELEEKWNFSISPTVVYEYPDIKSLAGFLFEELRKS